MIRNPFNDQNIDKLKAERYWKIYKTIQTEWDQDSEELGELLNKCKSKLESELQKLMRKGVCKFD